MKSILYTLAIVIALLLTGCADAGKDQSVTVIDVTPPVLTLNGEANITLKQNTTYTELGATATDAVDGDVNVTIEGSVDTSVEGTYTMTYTATDKAGNVVMVTRTVTVEIPPVIVVSIYIDANTTLIELTEHNATQIKVMATYSDNSSEDITQKATYTSSDSSVVDVDKGLVRTFKEGSSTVTISYGGKAFNVKVKVYEMIEGHLLPHEPENPDATLLGVDENDNGVRDEVERWIYKDMPTYHHPEIEMVVAMTKAKAYQMALVDPTNKEDKVLKAIRRAFDCWDYYSDSKNIPFDGAIEKFNNKVKDKQFNTRERLKTYLDYDYTLKGRVFKLTPVRLLDTSYCDQNIDLIP